jgi:hypothetical protein
MQDWSFENIDEEDLSDIILKVETAFNIQFQENELSLSMTVQDFYAIIINKINLRPVEDCTTQQVFYQMRSCIQEFVNQPFLNPKTAFEAILPEKNRIVLLKKIESRLGLNDCLIESPSLYVILNAVGILFLLILLVLGQWNDITLLSLILSLNCLLLKTCKDLKFQTIGEASEYITQHHYFKLRRNPDTYNPKEIKHILINYFAGYYDEK